MHKVLQEQRMQYGSTYNNVDLSFSVLLNLAEQFTNNGMYSEALNTYQVLVRDKQFVNPDQPSLPPARLKVNMANIYFKQKNYPKAIKFYRMALDMIDNNYKAFRIKIMENIGQVFLHMGQYRDAMSSFEDIMSESPNIKTGYNLVVCCYALGEKERMKKAFQRLISVPLGIDEEKYIPSNDDTSLNMVIDAIKNDRLHQMERDRKSLSEKYIMTAAKLIAPAIDSSFVTGFDWCVEMVKSSQYVELANDMEINKAIIYLRQKDLNQALETLKAVEKKDSRMKSAAATNLSFLHFVEKDFAQAERYADLAMNADRYNPVALINKGNVVFIKQDYEKAEEIYKEALRNDSSCTEALYNLGLTYKKLNRLGDAVECFLKLHAILRNSDQVMYQLANLYELLGDPLQSIEWLMQLISITPTDPYVHAQLGELYNGVGDKSQALHYYNESYKLFPSNIHVVEWLGAYYVNTQLYEMAIRYFESAVLIQPAQVKWPLMVASCYRKSGNCQKALETYKEIHHKFPENIESVRFLVRLCTDMDMKEVQEYATKLKKMEKMREIKEQRVKSGREGSARGRREGREGSAGSDRGHSTTSSKGERLNARKWSLPDAGEPYDSSVQTPLDAFYVDPLGPQMERPKTGAAKRTDVDDFADEELEDNMLPE
ncbi:intraflagellar transport protein 88 homolog isoform X1 [Thalassophryne amazonica]|uniref:intraflagellar transport protein 88 homolog isoform X1 n=2 Tax=Thalassophryne amazonica TaxID=390379 RepID=UPI0014724BA4|nr:intraflagellar transport protein 88 homolog isoform X1 [Thalassophryne amazonica]